MRLSKDICGVLLEQKETKKTKGGPRWHKADCALKRLLTRAALLVAIFRNHL